jgi:uncharacterized protein YjiS (DUF1127 family)
MLNSQSAIAAVRRHSSLEQASRVAPRGRRDIHPEQSASTTVITEAKPAMGPADTIWRSVLWFFIEGFALYGASVHWVATTAVTAIAIEIDAQQRRTPARRERQKYISLVPPVRATADHWAIWRREREINVAVAALSEHDDRTLRDMGIPLRSQIEQVVRQGRN